MACVHSTMHELAMMFSWSLSEGTLEVLVPAGAYTLPEKQKMATV